MKQWEDRGIVLSVRPYGEQSAILRVLTEHHGIHAGMVKGGLSKAKRPWLQTGNVLHLRWSARLEEQLGQMQVELLEAHAASLIAAPLPLKLMNAAASLLLAAFPERVSENDLFHDLHNIISLISCERLKENQALFGRYAALEHRLLEAMGYGLDLSRCAATDVADAALLGYVSPRSARAVSFEAGEPYKDKLLPLPPFVLALARGGEVDFSALSLTQILDSVRLTGYFLEKIMREQHSLQALPVERQAMADALLAAMEKAPKTHNKLVEEFE